MGVLQAAGLAVLTEPEIEAVHEASLQILDRVGIVFHSEEACLLFKQHGARVEGKTVFFPPSLVEQTLKSCPIGFVLKARNPEKSLSIGLGGRALAPTAGPVFIADEQGRRRPSSGRDYVNFMKLLHTSDLLNLCGGGLLVPADLQPEARVAFMLIASALYTDIPLPGFTQGAAAAAECLQLARIIFEGPEESTVLGTVNPTTPLVYDAGDIEAMLLYARAGQPVCVTACGMAGSTAPVTLAGTLAVNNAEVLAGIVLVELVHPANPVLYGNISSITDMRTVTFAAGAPEGTLLHLSACQMARRYKLPFRGGGALTDAKGADAQAGYESMMNLMVMGMAGYDYVLHAAGALDSLMSISYEKFIIDEEMGLSVQRLLKGMEVNSESLQLDLVAQIGSGGHYLDSDQTASSFRREFWHPQVGNRQPHAMWELSGAPDAPARARQVWQSRLEKYTKPELGPEIEKRLLQYFRERYGQADGLQPTN
jgi:trimethylamine---corrinoid protein Co-methyltransferase